MHLFDLDDNVLITITRKINDPESLMNWILTCKHVNNIGQKAKVNKMIQCLQDQLLEEKLNFEINNNNDIDSYEKKNKIPTRETLLTFWKDTNLLDWWLEYCNDNHLEFKFSEDIVMTIGCTGNVAVIEWWKIFFEKNNAVMYINIFLLCSATRAGNINILNWCKKYCTDIGQKIKFDPDIMIIASRGTDIDSRFQIEGYTPTISLDWWKTHFSDEVFVPNNKALKEASDNNQIEILEWWKKEYIENNIPFEKIDLDDAISNGHLKVLKWWSSVQPNSINIFDPNTQVVSILLMLSPLSKASRDGHLNTIKWACLYYKKNNINIQPNIHSAIESAVNGNKMDVLNWWYRYCKRNNLKFVIGNGIGYAINNKNIEMLEWFDNYCRKENEKFTYCDMFLYLLEKESDVHIWLRKHGHIKKEKFTVDGCCKSIIYFLCGTCAIIGYKIAELFE